MRTGQRKREILRQLYLLGYVGAKELAVSLGVDGSTIRRDLDALGREGHLERTHGGARARAGAIDIPYAVKRGENQAAKLAIAAVARELVRDGDSVLLDAGSTTHALALALGGRRNLTVVTNDLLIGQAVVDYPGVRLLVTGGELLTFTYTLTGQRGVGFVDDLRVDWTFLGADAIDISGGHHEHQHRRDPDEAGDARGRPHPVVLADSSKFGRRALVRVAGVDEVDRIITDDGLDPVESARYGERLVLAPRADRRPTSSRGATGREPGDRSALSRPGHRHDQQQGRARGSGGHRHRHGCPSARRPRPPPRAVRARCRARLVGRPCHLVREVLGASGVRPDAVEALAVSGIGPCALVTDATGRPFARPSCTALTGGPSARSRS